jgi:hypothetical protein
VVAAGRSEGTECQGDPDKRWPEGWFVERQKIQQNSGSESDGKPESKTCALSKKK